MTRTGLCRVAIGIALLLGAPARGADPATRPAATRPTTRRSDGGAARAAIQAAVAELSKEMGASLRKSASPPRTKSDYFSENPNDDVTPEAVLAAIARPSGDADARLQAYVKWQLLSALPEKVEEPKHAAALIRAYKTAPEPLPRPGVAPRDRAQLDKLAQGARETDAPKVEEQFEKLLEQSDVGNGPILAYRDELLNRLPPSYETYVAAFGDAVQRLEAGLDVADHLEAVSTGVREWAMSGKAPPQQLTDMLKSVRQLKGKEGPEY